MKYRHLRNLSKTKSTVRTITTLKEGPWRWALGIQAGIAMGVAMSVFILAGYPLEGTIASMGALSVLYGAKRKTRERLVILLFVGIGLMLSAAAGIFCASYEWLSSVCLVLVAAITGIITSGTGVGPPGPVMFVLAAAISTRFVQSAPPGMALGQAIPLLIGAGAFIAWIAVALLSLLPFARQDSSDPDLQPLTFRLKIKKEDILVVARIVAGITAAVLLSKPLGIVRVQWVIVAVTAILQAGLDRHLTTVRAFERVLGTLLGVFVFEALHLLELSGIWFIIAIVLLQFSTQVVIARNYVLGLIFITPMALLIATHSLSADTYITAKERVLDTLLGASLAIAVFWIEELIDISWLKPKSRQS